MVCNVCGTSVQEGVMQCPGCGAVRQVPDNLENMQAMPEFSQPVSPVQFQNVQMQAPTEFAQAAPPPMQYQNVQMQAPPVPYSQQFSHSAFSPQAMPYTPDTTSPLGWFGWMMLCGFGWIIAPALVSHYAKDRNVKNFSKMMLVLESVLTVSVMMLIMASIGLEFLDWIF